MASSISRIEAHGLFGRSDLAVNLRPDVNILYGRNGSGKTTILHILANVMNGSLERFAFLRFSDISMFTHDGDIVTIRRTTSDDPDPITITVTFNDERVLVYRTGLVKEIEASSIQRPARPRFGSPLPLDTLSIDITEPRYSSYLQSIRQANAILLDRLGGASYFPAFRAMTEAWRSAERTNFEMFVSSYSYIQPPSESPKDSLTTILARELFGAFVPTINYPSVLDVERELRDNVEAAVFAVARVSESILSDAFVKAFSALSETEEQTEGSPQVMLSAIEDLLTRLDQSEIVNTADKRRSDVYGKLQDAIPDVQTGDQSETTTARILAVYRDSLSQQVELQRQAYEPFARYIRSVNEFLERKRLLITRTNSEQSDLLVLVAFEDQSQDSLRALSSGERQIVSMLYAASRMKQRHVVLIDEPELSLHIDWQRLLIGTMASQLGNQQLIVCTHSPEIGAEYEDRYQEVKPTAYRLSDN